ncbi:MULTISPECIES: transcriptional regulator [unclassified Brevibacterium]|uniref:transcriptional regulator n=1 Tax=Micrococcales TaxID=85006 RepID=UPI00107FE8DD|nr:transcriptional regulator [Brevibacterium sp. S111]TGD10606.1 transcriptional regulator [Brevibacterium sp. S111]
MTHHSAASLLVLHAVRLVGFADSEAVAERAGTSHADALRQLSVAEHAGWVQHVAFADLDGWSLTDFGKAENERQLAAERVSADPDGVVASTYRVFLPLNARLLRAVTDWQIKPTETHQFAPNDHFDRAWDGRVLEELTALGTELAPLIENLSAVLARFDGYVARYELALRRAMSGELDWIDKTDIDSCHRVWFQLHEDLVATLCIDRRNEA